MLRIPLPEDDGFALALPEDNQAPKGRQSTDGGERSVTPGHVPLPPPTPSLAPSAQRGGVINLPCPGATRCLPPAVIWAPRRGYEDERESLGRRGT